MDVGGVAPYTSANAVSTADKASAAGAVRAPLQQLTPADQRRVEKLKSVDRAVHDHEAAHMRAGSGLVTSGPNYTYTYGPDGKRYAVGGEVGIDVSPTGKPQEDIDKGRRVEAAALAPVDPSAQDYAVAADARQMAAQGQSDLAAQRQQERVATAYGSVESGSGGGLNVTA